MIKKIIYFGFLFDLLLAISILIFWNANNIQPHTVSLGQPFRAFLSSLNSSLSNWQIEIPSIPSIPSIPTLNFNSEWWSLLLNFAVYFGGLIINFLNGLIFLLNFIITIINVLIKILQFIFIIITNFNGFRDNLIAQ